MHDKRAENMKIHKHRFPLEKVKQATVQKFIASSKFLLIDSDMVIFRNDRKRLVVAKHSENDITDFVRNRTEGN